MWDKVSNTIKKRFDGEPVYNEKYLRTKINSYKRKKEKSAKIFMEIKYQKKKRFSMYLFISNIN